MKYIFNQNDWMCSDLDAADTPKEIYDLEF